MATEGGRVRKGETEERRSDLTGQKEATGISEHVEVGKNTSSVNEFTPEMASINKAARVMEILFFSPWIVVH